MTEEKVIKKSSPFFHWIDHLIGIAIESGYVVVLSLVGLSIIFLLFKIHALGWF